MQKNILVIGLVAFSLLNNALKAQYIDRFDGSTTQNWQRVSSLDIGSANWSASYGFLYFSSPTNNVSENQVFVKNSLLTLSKMQNWSLEIGLFNSNNVTQLQVFVANSTFSDFYGVTLARKNNTQDPNPNFWGVEIPGLSPWDAGGITASADYSGSVKIEYSASTSTYSLLYANGSMDPISNNYSYNLLNSYNSSTSDPLEVYIGINSGINNKYSGAGYADNLKIVPEPSALSLLAVGLGIVLRRRRRTV